MLGAVPSLRLIQHRGLISLQANITPWITFLSCLVAAQTSPHHFALGDFLFLRKGVENARFLGVLIFNARSGKEDTAHLPNREGEGEAFPLKWTLRRVQNARFPRTIVLKERNYASWHFTYPVKAIGPGLTSRFMQLKVLPWSRVSHAKDWFTAAA